MASSRSIQEQIQEVQQQIENVLTKASEMEELLAQEKQAGNQEEVQYLRGQLEQLYKERVALREEKNLLLRAQQGDDSQAFKSCEEFKTFLKVEGGSEVQQFANDVWQTGHHSCASIARSSAELLAQHGPAIRQLLDFCRLRSVMITRSELLESTLPAPNISTSPLGLNQAEQPRQSHPETLQAFDVAPAVQTFIDGLLATPERFQPVDYRRLSLAAREAAVDKIWDSAVVESANSLVNFSLYFVHLRKMMDKQGSVHSGMLRATTRRHILMWERLSLHGIGQPIDWDHPPNLPEIWSRNHHNIPAVLQSSVDAVVAQVNAYAAAHGIQYGMISNILWSWAFVMDGRNNMQISQPLRYDATHPTVLQVHAWVTSMSLKGERLQPWQTLTHHPLATVPIRRSKRSQANISNLQNRKLSSRPGASKPAVSQSFNKAAAGRSNQKQQSLKVALHANASSLLPYTTSALQNGLYPEAVTQQAASEFKIGHILSVLAVGTSGPVFHARTHCGQKMALKIASLDSSKHRSLQHQTSCLMALRRLWGQCVPHVLLAGALTGHGHGYGLGTNLLHGRHPEPGDTALLPPAEEALGKVHRRSILVNDLHPNNMVLVADGNKARAFFAIQHYLQVLLSVKKSYAACVLSSHRRVSKKWLKAMCESVQQNYCGPSDMQQVVIILLLTVDVFCVVHASRWFVFCGLTDMQRAYI
ncbi:hypothetical protein ABBQ32_004824 [Trebouxia sp. C0010 RCD-2024]